MASKPIRVFYSTLSQRFYATRAWREIKPGLIECTGEKFDVSNDIAALVIQHEITFRPRPALMHEPDASHE
jgi:hypothetical protein